MITFLKAKKNITTKEKISERSLLKCIKQKYYKRAQEFLEEFKQLAQEVREMFLIFQQKKQF